MNKLNPITDDTFKEVCRLVGEQKHTIQRACNKLKINRVVFYQTMTKEQRLELTQIRHANTQYGSAHKVSIK